MQKNHLMNLLNIRSFNPTPKNSNSEFTVQLRNITVTPSDSGGTKVTLWKTHVTLKSPHRRRFHPDEEALCSNSQREQVLCKGFPEVFVYRLTRAWPLLPLSLEVVWINYTACRYSSCPRQLTRGDREADTAFSPESREARPPQAWQLDH